MSIEIWKISLGFISIDENGVLAKLCFTQLGCVALPGGMESVVGWSGPWHWPL